MSNGVPPGLMEWFKTLVRNKMSAIAAPVPGIAIGCALISFAALFDDPVHVVVTWLGLILLILMVGLFVVAVFRFVLYSPADAGSGSRGAKGGVGSGKNTGTPAGRTQPRAPHQRPTGAVGEIAAPPGGMQPAQPSPQPPSAEESRDEGL